MLVKAVEIWVWALWGGGIWGGHIVIRAQIHDHKICQIHRWRRAKQKTMCNKSRKIVGDYLGEPLPLYLIAIL